jgi:hypothetical protein
MQMNNVRIITKKDLGKIIKIDDRYRPIRESEFERIRYTNTTPSVYEYTYGAARASSEREQNY